MNYGSFLPQQRISKHTYFVFLLPANILYYGGNEFFYSDIILLGDYLLSMSFRVESGMPELALWHRKRGVVLYVLLQLVAIKRKGPAGSFDRGERDGDKFVSSI